METIDRIPWEPDPEAVARRLRFDPGRAGGLAFDALLDEARSLVALRAVTDVSYIGAKGEDTVEVAGVVFRSRVLRRNLDRAQKVFPYVMTAGPALEAAAVTCGDLLKQYYLEELGNMALESGAAWLAERLKARWGLPGLSSQDPGSLEDWPLEEQPKLFSIFGDTERLIGVRLTASLLMVPRKSISGIFFPGEEDFTSCQLCDRGSCPGRKAAYDERRAAEFK